MKIPKDYRNYIIDIKNIDSNPMYKRYDKNDLILNKNGEKVPLHSTTYHQIVLETLKKDPNALIIMHKENNIMLTITRNNNA